MYGGERYGVTVRDEEIDINVPGICCKLDLLWKPSLHCSSPDHVCHYRFCIHIDSPKAGGYRR